MSDFGWFPEKSSPTGAHSGLVSPDEILYEVDEPRIFITHDGPWKYLWYLCDKTPDAMRFLVTNTNEVVVDRLKRGGSTVLEAISLPSQCLVDVSHDFNVVSAFQTDINRIPERFLPKAHALLYSVLEPFLSLRLLGAAAAGAAVPASAVRRGVDGAYAALKKLAESVTLASPAIGRPDQVIRQLFDLPVQRLALGSVEIAFASHSLSQGELLDDDRAGQMGKMLTSGLVWASESEPAPEHSPILGVLEALEKLSPPLDGYIERVEIRGRALKRRRLFVLDRRASRMIKLQIKRLKSGGERFSEHFGFIRELDKDRESFILRSDGGEDIGSYVCEEDTFEYVLDAFTANYRVLVLGRETVGRSVRGCLAIVPADDPQ